MRIAAVTLLLCHAVSGFVSPSPQQSTTQLYAGKDDGNPLGGFFQGVSNFFAELDAFVDDASARRLGNGMRVLWNQNDIFLRLASYLICLIAVLFSGAAFYGKRKSNFYGESDKMRKADRDVADPLEDYQGPTNTGMFKWVYVSLGKLEGSKLCAMKAM